MVPAGEAVARAAPARTARSLTWMQRLKRVFDIDLSRCAQCGGAMQVIAEITDPAVIDRILAHLGKGRPRGPPVAGH